MALGTRIRRLLAHWALPAPASPSAESLVAGINFPGGVPEATIPCHIRGKNQP